MAILACLCFSDCTMPNEVNSGTGTDKLVEEFKNSISYMESDNYCRAANNSLMPDFLEFQICEMPKDENGKFLYDKKEKLGEIKLQKGEKQNIDFSPREGWFLTVKCSSLNNSIWYSWYASSNEYNIIEYDNSLFEQNVMKFENSLSDDVQGIEWTKGSKQFAYCENNLYISYHFMNADLCLKYLREKYSEKPVAKVSKNNPFE